MMLNYEEEQENELQVLEAIYTDEITVIARTPQLKIAFELRCKNDGDDKSNCDDYSITLTIDYPAKYPDEAPLIEITEQSELIDDEVANELLNRLNDEANQNLGMAMVFILVSSAIEWLNSLKDNASERQRLAVERKKQFEEEQERKRFEGTRCTVETFMKWKLPFEAEMERIRMAGRTDEIPAGKLTGKQLFERDRTLNDSDLKFLEEGDVAAEIDSTGVKVDASLFEDLDLEDEIDDDE